LSLIVLGLILANVEKGDPARTGINLNAWGMLALLGGVLFLSVYRGSQNYSKLHTWLRFIGLALIVAMLAIFRRTVNGHAAWLDGSYPEILGLIGYTYLAVSILYLPTRRWKWAPFAYFAALLVFNALCTGASQVRHIPLYFWPFGNGSWACLTMAGVAASTIFFMRGPEDKLRKIILGGAFGLTTLLAGWLLAPLGISKIRATPTWCLYSIATAVLLLTVLYWVADVKKQTSWSSFARPAGSNTLLTYLLPDFYYLVLGLAGVIYFDRHLNTGMIGALRSAVFTALVLGVSAILTKLRLRLKL
jgi:hypothetical protein